MKTLYPKNLSERQWKILIIDGVQQFYLPLSGWASGHYQTIAPDIILAQLQQLPTYILQYSQPDLGTKTISLDFHFFKIALKKMIQFNIPK